MPKQVYHAYGYVKKAAALVNMAAGRLEHWRAVVVPSWGGQTDKQSMCHHRIGIFLVSQRSAERPSRLNRPDALAAFYQRIHLVLADVNPTELVLTAIAGIWAVNLSRALHRALQQLIKTGEVSEDVIHGHFSLR